MKSLLKRAKKEGIAFFNNPCKKQATPAERGEKQVYYDGVNGFLKNGHPSGVNLKVKKPRPTGLPGQIKR